MIGRFFRRTIGILLGAYVVIVLIVPTTAPLIEDAIDTIRGSAGLTLLVATVPLLVLFLVLRRFNRSRGGKTGSKAVASPGKRRPAPPPVVRQGHGAREQVPQSLSDELAEFLNENLRR